MDAEVDAEVGAAVMADESATEPPSMSSMPPPASPLPPPTPALTLAPHLEAVEAPPTTSGCLAYAAVVTAPSSAPSFVMPSSAAATTECASQAAAGMAAVAAAAPSPMAEAAAWVVVGAAHAETAQADAAHALPSPTASLCLVGDGGCTARCTRRHPMHLPRRIRLPSTPGQGLILGRAESCDVQLDSLLHPTMISRRHARIAADGRGAWCVEDLGAANGTHVNGATVAQIDVSETGVSEGVSARSGASGGGQLDSDGRVVRGSCGSVRSAKRARLLAPGDVICFGTSRGRTCSDAVYRVSCGP